MKPIENIEAIRSIEPGWTPSDIAYIKGLEWSMDSLRIVFLSKSRKKMSRFSGDAHSFLEITMRFENTSSLKLNFSANYFHPVAEFDIINHDERGWEEINYEITDYENDTIKFFCRYIIVESVIKAIYMDLS